MNFNRLFIDGVLLVLLMAMLALPVGSMSLLSVDSTVVEEFLAEKEDEEGIVSGVMDVRIKPGHQEEPGWNRECVCPVWESSSSIR